MRTVLLGGVVLSLCALAASAAQIEAPSPARPSVAGLSAALDRQLDAVQPSAAASPERLAASLAAAEASAGTDADRAANRVLVEALASPSALAVVQSEVNPALAARLAVLAAPYREDGVRREALVSSLKSLKDSPDELRVFLDSLYTGDPRRAAGAVAADAGPPTAGKIVLGLSAATPRIGATALGTLAGVRVTPQQRAAIARLESSVEAFNRAYRDGYHALSHQIGPGSVADLSIKTGLVGLPKPEGLSEAVFDEVRVKFYLGALVHDVESVMVVVQKDGRTFVKLADGTKANGIDLAKLGAPVETRPLPGGDELRLYPKAVDSRSNLATTLATIREARSLADADDPLIKYFALKGTAFSPQERALRDRRLPALAAEIRARYGAQGDAVLALADRLAEKLGVADVMNHYVRDAAAALRASVSLEKEFADPKTVNVKGAFGFFKFVLAKDPVFVANYLSLPQPERTRFARNLAMFRLIQTKPSLLDGGVEAAIPGLVHDRRLDRLLDAHRGWPDLPFDRLVEAVEAALPTSA